MNIVVCMKYVPNTAHMKVDPETRRLVRNGVTSLINPADINALERALNLKTTYGGTITVLTMGIKSASECIEKGIAAGADDGYLISDSMFAGSDTYATSMILSAAVRYIEEKNNMKVDLILCGKVSLDGETAQTPIELAEHLNYPQVTSVLEIQKIGDKLWARQEEENEKRWLEVSMPALMTTEVNYREPLRPVNLVKLKELKENGVQKLSFEELKPWINKNDLLGKFSTTKVKRTYIPFTDRKKIVFTEGNDVEKAKILFQLLHGKESEIDYENN